MTDGFCTPHGPRRFRVKVGHSLCTVECETQEQAIRLARTKMCADMPRLWDVIKKMPDAHFRVEEAS
jgi:hypothetical protein